jgi:hypothetical protein
MLVLVRKTAATPNHKWCGDITEIPQIHLSSWV